MKRREFIGLGLAVVLFGPDAAAHALTEADAERIAHEWSFEIVMAPDRQALLPGIAADLKRLIASGDSHLTAYVAGRHAVEGIYGLCAPARALSLADDALAVTRAPCAGRMFALGTRAMALAMLGRSAATRFVRMIAVRALAVCERERVAGAAELREALASA